MSTVLVVQNEEDVPLGRMEGFLGDAGASLRILEAWREPLDTVLVTSELPDALLVLGGRMNRLLRPGCALAGGRPVADQPVH